MPISHPIADIAGIEPDMVAILKSKGIRTTTRLLEAAKDPKGRKALAEKTGIDEKRLLGWANMADRMRIKGVGREGAELLEAAGVDTVRELRYRNPANLASRMKSAMKTAKLTRPLPSEKVLSRWIDDARKLKLEIRYK
jgi:hypothetical protein